MVHSLIPYESQESEGYKGYTYLDLLSGCPGWRSLKSVSIGDPDMKVLVDYTQFTPGVVMEVSPFYEKSHDSREWNC